MYLSDWEQPSKVDYLQKRDRLNLCFLFIEFFKTDPFLLKNKDLQNMITNDPENFKNSLVGFSGYMAQNV